MIFKHFIIFVLISLVLEMIYLLNQKETFQNMHKYIYRVNLKNSPNSHHIQPSKNIISLRSEPVLSDYGVKNNIEKPVYHNYDDQLSLNYSDIELIIKNLNNKHKITNTEKSTDINIDKQRKDEMKKWIIKILNDEIKDYSDRNKKHEIRYRVVNENIIMSQESTRYIELKSIYGLKEDNKSDYAVYNIYFEIVYEKSENRYFIRRSRIVGNKIIPFLEDTSNCIIDGTHCKIDTPECDTVCNHKLSFMDNYQKEMVKTLSYVENENVEENLLSLFRCYRIDKNTIVFSLKQNKEECDKELGVWDRKCLSDQECPFFMANKNRHKYRGGCRDGMCEFPLGIIGISPRKYEPESVPLCGNCRKGYRCCKEQLNRVDYPNILSPDYLFKN